MTVEEKYMFRCIQLAENGKNRVRTNPMVGAVLVANGKIIGEGYHACYGQAHAEVNAIHAVKEDSLLAQATLYVSLEPCAHYGKTPPCAQLIIDKHIPRVVIGCRDPFSKVDGRGVQMLRNAGVDVKIGVLESECQELIRRFLTFHTHKRPYVILKWAESADGYLDRKRDSGVPVRFSTDLTMMLVHKRRAEVDAVLVGTNTALLDNPTLTVRNWYGKNPLRVVIDRHLRLPACLNLFTDGNPTLCFTEREVTCEGVGGVVYELLQQDTPILPQILSSLYEKGVQSVLVEGGAGLLQAFIDAGLWDEAYVEYADFSLGDGVSAPVLSGYSMSAKTRFGVSMRKFVHNQCG